MDSISRSILRTNLNMKHRYKIKENNEEECFDIIDFNTTVGTEEDEIDHILVAKVFELDDAVDITTTLNCRDCVGKTSKDMPPEVKEQYDETMAWANSNPIVLDLLYDLDLLPEQVTEGTKRWRDMVVIMDSMMNIYHEAENNK